MHGWRVAGVGGLLEVLAGFIRSIKELLPPKLIDRLIYAAKNFPESEWLEILPKEEGKKVRETYIVYESLENAFDRIRKTGEYPPEMPSDARYRKERRQARKLAA
jgi:hypothetical protein